MWEHLKTQRSASGSTKRGTSSFLVRSVCPGEYPSGTIESKRRSEKTVHLQTVRQFPYISDHSINLESWTIADHSHYLQDLVESSGFSPKARKNRSEYTTEPPVLVKDLDLSVAVFKFTVCFRQIVSEARQRS